MFVYARQSMIKGKILLAFVVTVAAMLVLSMALLSHDSRETSTSQNGVSITGLVDNELTLTLDDLTSRADTSVVAELICASGQSFGTHNWTGVKLKDLFGEAAIQSNAVKVAFYAVDNYSTDLTVSDAMRDDVIVALLKDGEPLEDGTQLVVPGKWGYKWISGIVSIELLDFDFKGTWERTGYSDDAEVRTLNPNHGQFKLP
jgi:DMSO/TMAO reductase YedYZ molybdopterin-dependent catalytic subunit